MGRLTLMGLGGKCGRLRSEPYSRAHSEGHPRTEGTCTGTLVNVGDLRLNTGEWQGGSREYHSFRNHYIFNSKTISLCNCNCNFRKIIPKTIF